jgi:hypothetical protein
MVARENEFDDIILPSEDYTGSDAAADFPVAVLQALQPYSFANGRLGLDELYEFNAGGPDRFF